MLRLLKHTAKQSIIYSIGNIAIKLIGLILLPIYTSYLSTAEYGILALFDVTIQLAAGVFSLRLSTSMMRWCANTDSVQDQRRIITSSLVATIIISVAFISIFMPFTKGISVFLFNIDNNFQLVKLMLYIVGFELVNKLTIDLIRLRENSVLYIVIVVLKFLLILILNIYFIVYKGYGVEGVLLSQLIGNVLQALLSIKIFYSDFTKSISFKLIGEMIKFGLPLVVSGISMVLLTTADRYLIKYYLDYSEVGIYSLGFKLASVLNVFVIQSFQLGFTPIAFKKYGEPDSKRYFQKTFTYLVFFLVFVGLAISLFSLELLEWFSKNVEFIVAYKIVPLLVLGFILRGIQSFLSISFQLIKKTQYNAIIILIGLVLNILLNFILIPELKIYGAAIATIIAWLVICVLFYILSNRYYFINYEIKKVFKIIILGVSIYIVSMFLNELSITTRLIYKSTLFLSFPAWLYFIRFYDAIELERISGFYHKWKNPTTWKENLLGKKE